MILVAVSIADRPGPRQIIVPDHHADPGQQRMLAKSVQLSTKPVLPSFRFLSILFVYLKSPSALFARTIVKPSEKPWAGGRHQSKYL